MSVQTTKLSAGGTIPNSPRRTKANAPGNKNPPKLFGDRSQRVRLIDGLESTTAFAPLPHPETGIAPRTLQMPELLLRDRKLNR
jgi:hypothetical protein